jgi:hypothetical protein
MNELIDDGGHAFPHTNPGYDGNWDKRRQFDGMSLRDYFAGQVLAGFMSAKPMHFNPDEDASYCYRVADAVIAARAALVAKVA